MSELPESMLRIAAVHGRFQPFHCGHLEYALRAYSLCDLLYIGITNSEPSHIRRDEASEHRHLPEANPFPFYVRMDMIIGSMIEAGASISKLRVVPFPINRPELITNYVPPTATHYVSVFDAWGERKISILLANGYKAVAWTDMAKLATGTAVRKDLDEGHEIQQSVPPYVATYLRARGNIP
jgi:cytidyltransferase-like protein